MPKEKGIENQSQVWIDNMAPPFDTERARKAQVASVKARKANKEAREKLKMSTTQWALYKKEVLDEVNISSLDVLKILMLKALEEDDQQTAADLAKSIAEFETPKLARIESSVEEVKTDEMSDEELNARIKELMNGQNNSSNSSEGSS